MQKRKIIIIGSGAAAYSFIENHRLYNKSDQIVVFSKEKHPFYNRIQLPDYINENKEWNSLLKTTDEDLYNLDIELKYETSVVSIDKHNKELTDSNYKTHRYDMLIIATGSKPIVPDNIKKLDNTFTIRTREDADAIKTTILNNAISNITIIGSGILGIEMADAVNELGLNTTLIARGNKLMSRQLDETAASILAKDLNEKGIKLLFNHAFNSIKASENKKIQIEFEDRKTIETDLLIFAIGTSPVTNLASEAGLLVNKGITVNEFMQSSDPNIFAIGEVAEYNAALYGITTAAEDQALACTNFLAGNYFDHYKGSVSENILKCSGLKLCTLGEVEKRDNSVEEIVLLDSNKGYYKKCFVQNDRLIGAILMGDTGEYSKFKDLIKKKTELGEERDSLLRSAEKEEPVLGNLVCSCNRVGRGNLEYFIQNGCNNFEGLMVLTKAGTGCGSCKPEIKKILTENSVTVNS